jgi:glutamine amidotransferase
MQILFEKGFEGMECEGLGLLKGEIKKIEPKEKVKIPHMGWNKLIINKEDEVIDNLGGDKFIYYVHSFMATEYKDEDLVAYSNYGGVKIPGIFRSKNIIGMQFHPEKSGEVGLSLLEKFGEMIL